MGQLRDWAEEASYERQMNEAYDKQEKRLADNITDKLIDNALKAAFDYVKKSGQMSDERIAQCKTIIDIQRIERKLNGLDKT